MKLEDAIEKSERMHALLVGPAPGNEPHNMEDLIVADAKLKNHCRKQLPRLLKAAEAIRPECDYESDEEMEAAATEFNAAIAAAKIVPDA